MVDVNKLICFLFAGILQIEPLNGLCVITISTAKLHFSVHIHKFCLEKSAKEFLLSIDFLCNKKPDEVIFLFVSDHRNALPLCAESHIKSGLYPLYSFANTYSQDWYFVLHWRENDVPKQKNTGENKKLLRCSFALCEFCYFDSFIMWTK